MLSFLNKDLFYSIEYAYDVIIYYVKFTKLKYSHQKNSISWNFNKISVKIIKKYVCEKSMGFKMLKMSPKLYIYIVS
jgi:hypothetical protein